MARIDDHRSPRLDDDPDRLWKPGWSGDWVTTPSHAVHREGIDDEQALARRPRRLRPFAALAVLGTLVAAAVCAAIVITNPATSSTPADALAALPRSIDEQWRISGPEFVAAADFDDDDEFVVAILDDGQPGDPARLVAYDGATGDERWRTVISLQPSQVDLAAVFADTVVVSVRRSVGSEVLVGLDAVDGHTLWERPGATGAQFTEIVGAGVLAERDALSTPGSTQLIDTRTGATVDEFVGRIEQVGVDGVIEYINDRSEFVVADLTDRNAAHDVVLDDIDDGDHAAVLGDHVGVVRSNGDVEVYTRSGERLVDRHSSDELTRPTAIVRTGADRAVIASAAGLVGLTVIDEATRFDWATPAIGALIGGRDGDVVAVASVADDVRGRGFVVVDALTGDELTEDWIPRTGADPILAADGIVTRETDHLGGDMSAFTFDGSRLWKISEAAVTRFGSGRVLALTNDPETGFVLTAYGEAS